MKTKIILAVTIFLSSIVLMAQAQDKKVAVFDPAGDVTSSIKEIVREEISSVIVNTGGYTVLERALINKVLEENKMQQSGLVDDTQISEIGKRMGANYVLVTSVTSLGTNYYVSVKMIEVLTAKIEKQKTARTTHGANDLIDVAQKMVKDMLGTITVAETKPTVTEKPVQAIVAEKPVIAQQPQHYGTVTASKTKVYLNGSPLSKYQTRQMLAVNPESLNYYNSGLRTNAWGKGLVIGGYVIGGIGLLGMSFDDYDSYVSMTSMGVGLLIGGYCLKASAKKKVRTAVESYNGSHKSTDVKLNFGFTKNGIGLAINF
ncbi:MAG: CsgG/HfaB family protein [Prevotellaceae bacterium]|jgi:hypothetical protein|nr:CsgG/HfaB family protein [Prevotellaceae bacterium]